MLGATATTACSSSKNRFFPPAANPDRITSEANTRVPSQLLQLHFLLRTNPHQPLSTTCEQRLGPQERSVSNSGVHTNHLGIWLKYRVWSIRQGWVSDSDFWWAPRGCGYCWCMNHMLSRKNLRLLLNPLHTGLPLKCSYFFPLLLTKCNPFMFSSHRSTLLSTHRWLFHTQVLIADREAG